MRVLHVLPGLGAAGAETVVRNLCLGLPREQITQEIALSTLPEQFYEPELRAAGVAIHRTAEMTGARSLVAHLRALYRLLRSAKKARDPYDVVHCHMDYLNGTNALIAWLAGVPRRVVHSHIAVSRAQQPSRAVRLYRAGMRCLLRRFATDYFACSAEASRSMFPWLAEGKRVVLLNGIHLDRFAAARHTPEAIVKTREALGLPTDARVLIIVARITEPKNPLFAVEVLAETVHRCPEAVLLWCGGGDAAQLRERAAACGVADKILFLGSRRDIPELMAASDCFLLPSKWEGFGIVLVEAQAAGLPCIASDQVPMLADAGGCRFLPLELGAAGWAEQIAAGLQNGFPERADPARLRKFDVAEMCRSYASLLLDT
ncbi:MAG: glycosyltransferase [Oscillospiraceae bacterium]|jgi:glycosyltransferase EpsF|nr:glycosyltransferase [Oscillospiraceae bacterium]